jgi:pimeloyl-ACP methyl ester carboxylesterase
LKPAILFIPGAYSTGTSFSYIKTFLLESEFQFYTFEYDLVNNPRYQIEDDLKKELISLRERHDKICVIGHSYGGALARSVAISDSKLMDCLVTIASPHGGIDWPPMMEFVVPNYFIRNTSKQSYGIYGMQSAKLDVPHFNIIAASGKDLFFNHSTDNDTVVDVQLQTVMDCASFLKMPLNHFEVLLDSTVAQTIQNFVKANLA